MSVAEPHWEFHNVPDPAMGLEAAYQGRFFELLGLNNPRLNQQLEVRAAEAGCQDGWHRVLLLTPWMALRAYVPEEPEAPPGLPEPAELDVDSAGRVAVGEEVALSYGGSRRRLEVAFDPRVGHHLVEVFSHDMRDFGDPDAAWEWLLGRGQARDAGSESPAGDPPPAGKGRAERRVSRRDLFRGLLGRR
jgi:hypothetical protein